MRCAKCFKPVEPAAKTCPHCGAPLPGPGAAPSGAAAELAKLRAEIAGQMRSAIGSLEEERAKLAGAIRGGQPAAMPAGATPLVHPQEWAGLLNPLGDQLNQSARFVFDSPFIQGNPLYQHRIGQVSFVFVPSEGEVNAFATDHPVPISDDRAIEPPVIVFYGGLGTALRLAAASLAVHIRARRARGYSLGLHGLSDALHLMGRKVSQRGGSLDVPSSIEIFRATMLPEISDDEERFVSLARSYAAAMDMFVVAHEAGHLALGHTLGRALNYDVSRNQEREADSFASSALSTSPFREYLFLGQVFVTIVFAWVEAAARARQAGTHPLARERFLHAIESNSQAAREAAEEFGLTRESLMEMLPNAV